MNINTSNINIVITLIETSFSNPATAKMAGIGRIETKLKNQLSETDRNISVAFQDLSQLMLLAKQMTTLSKNIASKIKEHGSQVTSDETVLFKSQLLELGIEHQVDIGTSSACKSSFSSNDSYFENLARQIASIIRPIMERNKQDQLTLSDVYCCFNRARGLDLISPDDIMDACKCMSRLPEIPFRLVQYSSGLLVIQKQSCDNESILDTTSKLVGEATSLTSLQLAARLAIPIQLARQRLTEAETAGLLCRDESIEGLRFYPNKFIHNQDHHHHDYQASSSSLSVTQQQQQQQ